MNYQWVFELHLTIYGHLCALQKHGNCNCSTVRVCLPFVARYSVLMATFRPRTAGLYQAMVSIYLVVILVSPWLLVIGLSGTSFVYHEPHSGFTYVEEIRNVSSFSLWFVPFRCIFSSLHDVTLTQQEPEPVSLKRSTMLSSALRNRSVREDISSPIPSHDFARFRKISDMVMQASKETDAGVRRSSMLTSTTDARQTEPDWHSHLPRNVAVAVTSEQGETLELKTKVRGL